MRAQRVSPKEFEFYFPDLDNNVLVECADDGSVRIRAVRNNFSEQRKAFFIRQIATEGFIPDAYQFFSGSLDGFTGIQWVVDYSWLKIPAVVIRRVNRFMGRALLLGFLIWSAAMTFALVGASSSDQKILAPAVTSPVESQQPSATAPG